jgi:hypothetical protein
MVILGVILISIVFDFEGYMTLSNYLNSLDYVPKIMYLLT